MVEEIHMLETKGVTTEARQHHQTSSKNDQLASASEGSNNQPKSDNQPAHRFGGAHASHSIPEKQFQCLEMGSSSSACNEEQIGMEEDQWNQEKRSKLDCQITTTTPSMDGTVMGFMPYRRSGL